VYHAGVLRAFAEAGVKIDLVAGMGVGVASALFAAVDGANRLWEPNGVWRGSSLRSFYRPHLRHRAAFWAAGLTVLMLAVPLLVATAAVLLWLVAFLLNLAHAGAGAAPAAASADLIALALSAEGFTTVLPRLVMLALLLMAVVLGAGWIRGRARVAGEGGRRAASGPSGLGPALDTRTIGNAFTGGLWRLMRGAAAIGQPSATELSRAYTEILSENLGQPGFRELMLTAHDLDVRRDLVFALLPEQLRRRFFGRGAAIDSDRRQAETVDLAGTGRGHALDALGGGLSVLAATEAHAMPFAAESFWRGETHRLCYRPEALGRLLDELVGVGIEQAIVISANAEIPLPHMLAPARRDDRGRLGEYLAAVETAAIRDAVASRRGRFRGVFQIRSMHNPIGPFDFSGAYDPRSDRIQTLSELADRGYEDAYRQFIDPVVGASGDRLASTPVPDTGAGG
jgi:hypothetical protein